MSGTKIRRRVVGRKREISPNAGSNQCMEWNDPSRSKTPPYSSSRVFVRYDASRTAGAVQSFFARSYLGNTMRLLGSARLEGVR